MFRANHAVPVVFSTVAFVLPAVAGATCTGKAPALEIEVVSAPLEWSLDHDATLAEINHGEVINGMISLGVTSAALGVEYDYKAWGPQSGAASQGCPRARIRLDVSVNPVLIRIGREVAVATCTYEIVRSHEWRHVQVYEQVLERAPAELKVALERAEATADDTGPDQATRLRSAAAAWLEAQSAAINAAHAAIDTPDEYARVSQTCNDLLARVGNDGLVGAHSPGGQ